MGFIHYQRTNILILSYLESFVSLVALKNTFCHMHKCIVNSILSNLFLCQLLLMSNIGYDCTVKACVYFSTFVFVVEPELKRSCLLACHM